jgi:capsular polysaccharide biosynthesis protein/Tfp pilus assembly protein PilF
MPLFLAALSAFHQRAELERAELTVSPQQILSAALAAHQAGDFAAAGAGYCRVLAFSPAYGEAWRLAGVAALQAGAAPKAVGLIARAVRRDPGDAEAWANLAGGLAQAGRQGAGFAAHQRALALNPSYIQAFNSYGAALRDGGDDGAAAVNWRRALRLDPGRSDTMENLGVALTAGDPAEAVEAVDLLIRAAELNGGRPDTLAKLGDALIKTRRWGAALNAFKRALAVEPDHLNARLGEVKALDRAGDRGQAVARCRALLDVAERAGDADALLQATGMLFDQGDGAGAAAAYRRFTPLTADRRRFPGDGARAVTIRSAAAVCAARGLPYRRLSAPRRHQAMLFDGETLTYELPETFIARIDDAEILPGNQSAVSGDALLLDGLNPYSRASLGLVPRVVRHAPDERALLDMDTPAGDAWSDEEAVLLGGSGNFSHNLNDWLSRLAVLQQAPELDGLPLLLAADASPGLVELLRLLGVDPARLVRAAAGRIERRRRLWVPSLTHHFQHAAPEYISFIRRRLAPLLEAGRADRPRRLYLTRRNAGYRAVVSEPEVLQALAPFGIEVIAPEDFSVAVQIRLFAAAELIIGPVGGGSAAMMFAPPGAAVVELTHDRMLLPQYPILAALLGLRFARVVGRRTENRGPFAFDWDFRLSPEAVAAAVRAALDGCGAASL